MGAWGPDIFENDAAADLKNAWDAAGATTSAEKALAFAEAKLEEWEPHVLFADASLNAEIIALGCLCADVDHACFDLVREITQRALSLELRPDALAEWQDKKARRRALVDRLQALGLRRVTVRQSQADLVRAAKDLLRPEVDALATWHETRTPPTPSRLLRYNHYMMRDIVFGSEHAAHQVALRKLYAGWWTLSSERWPPLRVSEILRRAARVGLSHPQDPAERLATEATQRGEIFDDLWPYQDKTFDTLDHAVDVLEQLGHCWGKGPVSFIEAHHPGILTQLETQLVWFGYDGDNDFKTAINRRVNSATLLTLTAVYLQWTPTELAEALESMLDFS